MAVDGTYRVILDAFGSSTQGTVTLKSNGQALSGEVYGMGMDAQLENGKVDGQSFSGTIEGPTPLGTMRFKVSGKVDGNAIAGTLKAGLVKATFEGTRTRG